MVHIVDLSPGHPQHLTQAAGLLYDGFRDRSPAWPTWESAMDEVRESLAPEKVSRVAVDEHDRVLGWIGGQPQYDGHVWELHPLVVARDTRRQGIGRALVADLERIVSARGCLTLCLGSDDEIAETSLAGADLYDDLPARLRDFRPGGAHGSAFYLRVGFRLIGVMPDANGRGKPDIYFAKRIAR